eukprot:326829_1
MYFVKQMINYFQRLKLMKSKNTLLSFMIIFWITVNIVVSQQELNIIDHMWHYLSLLNFIDFLLHGCVRASWKKYTSYGEEKQLFYVGKDLNNRVLCRSIYALNQKKEKKATTNNLHMFSALYDYFVVCDTIVIVQYHRYHTAMIVLYAIFVYDFCSLYVNVLFRPLSICLSLI